MQNLMVLKTAAFFYNVNIFRPLTHVWCNECTLKMQVHEIIFIKKISRRMTYSLAVVLN